MGGETVPEISSIANSEPIIRYLKRAQENGVLCKRAVTKDVFNSGDLRTASSALTVASNMGLIPDPTSALISAASSFWRVLKASCFSFMVIRLGDPTSNKWSSVDFT